MSTTISGSTGVTFPAGGVGNTAGAAVGTTDTQTLTNKTLGSGLVADASLITSGTVNGGAANPLSSGTSVNFTGIPSWAKRITVIFNAVSLSASANFLVQIGAGSVATSGYTSTSELGATVATSTSGFVAVAGAAANSFSGSFVLTTLGSNVWVSSATIRTVNTGGGTGGVAVGNITLGGTLDRVSITTTSTDTFDAGSINLLFE
jgi:hypothetical protein